MTIDEQCSLFPSLVLFSQTAVVTLDQKVLAKTKRLNALKHTTQTYHRRLDELKTEYERLKPEGVSGTKSTDARTMKKEEDAMVITSLTSNNTSLCMCPFNSCLFLIN